MRSFSTRWWDLCQQDDEIFVIKIFVNKSHLISSLLSVSYSARIFSSFVGRGMFLYLLTLLSVWIRRSEQNTWSWGQENNFWSSCSDSHPSSGWACCTGFLSPQELQVGWTGKKGSMVFSIEFNSIATLVTWRDQERTIQAASRADRNPRAQPVPSGQKGSNRLMRKNETILISSQRETFQESEICPALV